MNPNPIGGFGNIYLNPSIYDTSEKVDCKIVTPEVLKNMKIGGIDASTVSKGTFGAYVGYTNNEGPVIPDPGQGDGLSNNTIYGRFL